MESGVIIDLQLSVFLEYNFGYFVLSGRLNVEY